MSTAYYSKELPEQPLYIGGKPYRFDFLATEDPALIKHLDLAAARHVGGVLKISQAQYEAGLDEKKKQTSTPSSRRLHQREEVRQKLIPSPRRGAGRVAAGEDSKAAATPDKAAVSASAEQYRPKTSKGLLA